MGRRWTVNPPMGQVIGGWAGAMIVLGIAGGWLFGPAEVTLHTVPMTPRPSVAVTPAGSTPAGSSESAGSSGSAEVDAQRAADRRSGTGRGHGNSRGVMDRSRAIAEDRAEDRSDGHQPDGDASERR